MTFCKRVPSILAVMVCAGAVAALTLTVVPPPAIAQNQEVTDTTETEAETLLPDGRTLAEWLLEAYVLLDKGQHTRVLVEWEHAPVSWVIFQPYWKLRNKRCRA